MKLDIIKLLKKHTGKCKGCGNKFIAWEVDWDGACKLNLCEKCDKEKREKEEREYRKNFNEAKEFGRKVFTITDKLAGWSYKNEFYENPDFEPEYKKDIDDYIRQEKRKGIKEMKWIPQDFEALQNFAAIFGYNMWQEKEFTFMGVCHSISKKQ